MVTQLECAKGINSVDVSEHTSVGGCQSQASRFVQQLAGERSRASRKHVAQGLIRQNFSG